jgi:hypothetical protein
LKWLLRSALILAALAASAVAAWLIAMLLGELGVYGDCFEGACGYAVVFVWFPLLWLGLSVLSVGSLCYRMFRRPPG